MNEHLESSYASERPLKYVAIHVHCNQCNHQNNRNSFNIVGGARNDFYLPIKEGLMTYRMGKTFNKADKSIPLHLFEERFTTVSIIHV